MGDYSVAAGISSNSNPECQTKESLASDKLSSDDLDQYLNGWILRAITIKNFSPMWKTSLANHKCFFF